ncbi:MAG: gp436 family protein [Desulfovibrionaceae bacterium]
MYATPQDIEDRYGRDALLTAADLDGDGEPDAALLDSALADATAEIDVYLTAQYVLPLPVVPAVVTRLAVDIALYRVASTADRATEEQRKRYEDAVGLLTKISKGVVSLGLAPAEQPASSPGVVTVSGPPRRFGRGSL